MGSKTIDLGTLPRFSAVKSNSGHWVGTQQQTRAQQSGKNQLCTHTDQLRHTLSASYVWKNNCVHTYTLTHTLGTSYVWKTNCHTYIPSQKYYIPPICFTPLGLFYKEVCGSRVIHFSLSFLILCNKNCLATKSYMKKIIDSAIQTKAIDLSFPIPKPTFPHRPPLKKKKRQREFDLAMKWKVNLICRQKRNNKKLEKGQNLFIIEGSFFLQIWIKLIVYLIQRMYY